MSSNYSEADDQFILDNAGKTSWKAIGKKLGVSRHQARGRWWHLTHNKGATADPASQSSIETTEKGDTKTIICEDPSVTSVTELIERCKIDMNVWEIKESKVGVHEGFFRDHSWRDGKTGEGKHHWRRSAKKVKMFAVKVILQKRKRDDVENEKLRTALIADMNQHSPKYNRVPRFDFPPEHDRRMAEVSIYDHHFGKLAWLPETDENYDLKIAAQVYMEPVHYFAKQLEKQGISQIVFPIGNDMLHVDNGANLTNAGTPQDTEGRWQKAYLECKRCIIEAIDVLRLVAPVKVIVIPGNHDKERMFFLGDTVQSHFRLDSEVEVDNSPKMRKYFRWGRMLVGLTHGDKENRNLLPLLMANEAKMDFAQTDFHEFHMGHEHRRKEVRFVKGEEDLGVGYRILPSLCGTDSWHKEKGYMGNIKAAECFVIGEQHGMMAQLSYQPKPETYQQ